MESPYTFLLPDLHVEKHFSRRIISVANQNEQLKICIVFILATGMTVFK